MPAFHVVAAAVTCLRAAAGPAASRQTLDHLRADLSHEMAAKLARLAGFTREWRDGRFRDEDARDSRAIITDIRRLHLRHARTAAGSLATFGLLVRTVATIAALQRHVASAARARRGNVPAVTGAERELALLVTRSRARSTRRTRPFQVSPIRIWPSGRTARLCGP